MPTIHLMYYYLLIIADIKLTIPLQLGLEIDGLGFRETEIIYDLIGGGGVCFMWLLLLVGLLLK